MFIATFLLLALPIHASTVGWKWQQLTGKLSNEYYNSHRKVYHHPQSHHNYPTSPELGGGVDIAIAPDFVTFLGQGLASVLPKAFHSIDLPNSTVDTPVPVLGEIHLTLNDTRIFRVQTDPEYTVVRLGPGLISMNLTGFNVSMSSKWRWTKGILHSHGVVNVTAVNGSISALISLQSDRNGYPVVGIHNASLILGDLDVQISESKWTWLYSLIKSVFKNQIVGVVQSEVPNQMTTSVPVELNKFIQTLPLSFKLYKNVQINVGLTESPVIDPKRGLHFDRVGQISVLKRGRMNACPVNKLDKDSALFIQDQVQQQDISRGFHKNRMIKLIISEQFLNCLLWGLHTEEFFTLKFKLDDIIPIPTRNLQLVHSLLRLNSSEPAATVTVSLPKQPPVLFLNDDGTLVVTIEGGEIAFRLLIAGRQPFVLRLRFSASLNFLLRVVEGGGEFLEMDLISSDFSIRKDAMTQKFVDMDKQALVSQLHASALGVLSNAIQKFLVPVPIKLPYPFDSIKIKDFGLHIERKRWILEADFGF